MKKTTKAVLLSLLIFPGLGHLISKAFARGLLWFCSAAAVIGVLTVKAMHIAQTIAASLNVSTGLDINQLLDTANQITAQHNPNGLLNVMSWMMGLIWIAAAVDAYRLAKRV
jgi:hypothetical protein